MHKIWYGIVYISGHLRISFQQKLHLPPELSDTASRTQEDNLSSGGQSSRVRSGTKQGELGSKVGESNARVSKYGPIDF